MRLGDRIVVQHFSGRCFSEPMGPVPAGTAFLTSTITLALNLTLTVGMFEVLPLDHYTYCQG